MPLPRDRGLDQTWNLLREGYLFISNRCERLGSDIFETRVMFRKAICLRGEEAAKIFFDRERFTRKGAIPATTVKLLQGRGSVQTKNGPAHGARKALFMDLLNEDGVQKLLAVYQDEWFAAIPRWRGWKRLVLHREFEELLCRSVCRWAGLNLNDDEIKKRRQEFSAMVEQAEALGPGLVKGLVLRTRSEKWVRGIIRNIRSGTLKLAEDSPAGRVALHRDPNGELLSERVAAVELINLLRPVTAVSRFLTFGALALHEHPSWQERIARANEGELENFAQEVRRFYPFFPLIGGRALKEFTWQGHVFPKGAWVLFDVYGTNHHSKIWSDPETFNPDRFQDWDESPYNFVAQGGGSAREGHRCPGERLTVELVKVTLRLLTNTVRYEVPAQDLSVRLTKLPALPASGFVVSRLEEKIESPSIRSSFLDARL